MQRRIAPLAAVLLACLAGAAAGQSFPGAVPDEIRGDWDCGDTRAYVTGLGSIELLGASYRAGRIDAGEGVLRILWDEGGREDWRYDAAPDALTLTDPAGAVLECRPRG